MLKDINSKKSFDPEFRKKAFDDWQEYAVEEAFVIPTLYRNETMPLNTRVTGWDWHQTLNDNPWASIGVTAEKR